nr:hypothetical protein [Tanacetum cinerariifolium]
GQLLLSPQQVVLGNDIEKVYTRYPRTIVDLIHLHGQTVQIHKENPFPDAEDEGVFNSSCSRSMTGNKERLDDFQEFQGRKVTFGGGEDTECLVLSKDFKLPDESMVVLKVPRKHNLYTINLNNLCPRGKQHKASYKAINAVSSIFDPLQFLHMDLFGPISIRSIDHKYYCLVITDDFSRFCWVFFIEHKDETYLILKDFINLVENQLNKKVKAMRCDNVRTACYVLNRVLVTSPHNKTPFALLTGNIPSVSHFKTFGCHVTILNTSDHLGKFDGKADEGYIVGYSASNKAYRVYNMPNKRVKKTMNLRYLEDKPNVQGLDHEWYFDLDYLTDTLGYKHVQANQSAGTQEATTNPAGTQDDDSNSECDEQVIIVPSYPSHSIQGTEPTDTSSDEVDDSPLNSADELFQKELARLTGQEQRATSNAERLELSIPVPTGNIPVPAGDTMVSTDDAPVHTSSPTDLFFDDKPTTRFLSPSNLGNHDPSPGIFSFSSYDDEFGAALNNVASTVEALEDPSWVDAMQEEMQPFKFQNVWVLFDLPEAFASYMEFMVYQMDVKSAFLYERIDEEMDVKSAFLYERINEEVYVTQPKDSEDEAPLLWSALVGWEVIPTPLGDISALYRIDRSTIYFTTLRKILHMVDRQDLLKLYGLVVKYYENHHVAGAGHLLLLLFVYLMGDNLTGEGAGVAAQAVPQHMPAPDQPQDHLSTPLRQQTSDPTALVFEQDEPLGGSFYMSPPSSTQAPPAGQTSGGAEDLITITALSSIVFYSCVEGKYFGRQYIQIQAFSRTLRRTGPVLKEPSSKRQKSTEAPISSVPEVPPSPVVSSPKSSGTRRKSLGRNRLTKHKSKLKELDLDADDQTFIKVVSNEDSEDEAPLLWSALVGWEVIPTPLGDISALYRIDRSTIYFTTLRKILHMVDRQDLLKLFSEGGTRSSKSIPLLTTTSLKSVSTLPPKSSENDEPPSKKIVPWTGGVGTTYRLVDVDLG